MNSDYDALFVLCQGNNPAKSRPEKKVRFVLPQGFDPTSGLPPGLHRYAWRAAYAIHLLCHGAILNLSRYRKHKRLRMRPCA